MGCSCTTRFTEDPKVEEMVGYGTIKKREFQSRMITRHRRNRIRRRMFLKGFSESIAYVEGRRERIVQQTQEETRHKKSLKRLVVDEVRRERRRQASSFKRSGQIDRQTHHHHPNLHHR
jgi:hypothetical protein